jgi:hypothetical protein
MQQHLRLWLLHFRYVAARRKMSLERTGSNMSDDKLFDVLLAIEQAVSGDQYEPGPIKTVGGPTGSYILRSPYNTECEWSPVAAFSSGANISNSGALNLSLATIPSSARATFSQQYNVGYVENLAIDFNVTALTGGAAPTVTFKISRLGLDGILYQLEQATALSAAGTISYNIGSGFDAKGFGNTIQVDMVLTGAPTSVTFSGSIQGGITTVPPPNAGFIALSSSDPSIAQITTSAAFGALANGEEGNAFDGLYIPLSAPSLQAYAPFEVWQPLGRGANIYVCVNSLVGSGLAYLQIAFRRKLLRYIPDKPRQQPHTHTHPQSRMHQRKLAAQSTMVAGFEEQYPVEGGKPYSHADPRAVLGQGTAQQQLAPGQDTAITRKGVFSLGRTDNVRRRR